MSILVMGLADTLFAPASVISLIHGKVAVTWHFATFTFCVISHHNPRPSRGATAAPNPRMGDPGECVNRETFLRDLWARPWLTGRVARGKPNFGVLCAGFRVSFPLGRLNAKGGSLAPHSPPRRNGRGCNPHAYFALHLLGWHGGHGAGPSVPGIQTIVSQQFLG